MRTSLGHNVRIGICGFCLLAIGSQTAYAFDDSLFLDARTVIQEDASSSSSQDYEQYGSSVGLGREVSLPNTQDGSSENAWVGFKTLLRSFQSYGHAQENELRIRSSLANARISEIGDTWATLTWSRKTLANLKVYYASTSPVILSDDTSHLSPLMAWNRERVTLRGLSPNTTYFYRLVTETNTGTTTSAEMRFQTESRR